MQVIRRKIPIRIKNVENPQGGGTVIHPDPDIDSILTPAESLDAPFVAPAQLSLKLAELTNPSVERGARKLPTAVTIKERIVVLNVNSNRKSVSHGFLAGIFGTLDRYGVVVDLISTSEVHVSMAIEDGLNKKVMDKVVRELQKSGTVRCIPTLFTAPVYQILLVLPHRCPLAEAWPSCRLSASTCAIASASLGACLRPLDNAT